MKGKKSYGYPGYGITFYTMNNKRIGNLYPESEGYYRVTPNGDLKFCRTKMNIIFQWEPPFVSLKSVQKLKSGKVKTNQDKIYTIEQFKQFLKPVINSTASLKKP